MQPKSSTSTQPVPANKEISHHYSKPDIGETMTATEDRETPADKETSEATQNDKRKKDDPWNLSEYSEEKSESEAAELQEEENIEDEMFAACTTTN